MQQTVTVRSCRKNAGAVDFFPWLLAHQLLPVSLNWPATHSVHEEDEVLQSQFATTTDKRS